VIVTGVLKDDVPNSISAIDGLNRITKLQVLDAGSGALTYSNEARTANTGISVGVTAGDVVWAIKTADASSYSYPKEDMPDNAPLMQYQADMYDVGNQKSGNAADYMWFATENYVIGNGGEIRTASDFTNSSSDPFTLLKSNALESVMYVKQSQGTNVSNPTAITNSDLAKAAISDTDYFAYNHATNGTNIDIVFIPDLLVAAVQRMLPAITNIGD
jgi:hypothetical protein